MPTQLGSDTFTRANETPLASPWLIVSTDTTMNLSSNAVVLADLGNNSSYRRSGLSPDADQYSEVDVTMSTTSTATGPGPACRMSGSGGTASLYCIFIELSVSGDAQVYRSINTAFTNIATRTTSGGGTWPAGNTARMEVTGINSSIVVKIFQEGVQLGADIADNPGTGTVLNAGDFGIAYSSTNSAVVFDNWAGGNMAAGGANTATTMWWRA